MNITGGESLSLFEAQEAADIVQDAADEDVNMIFGTVINPELQDEIVVTVIATGFEDKPTSQGRKAQVLVSEQVQLQALQHKQVRQEKNHSLKAHQALVLLKVYQKEVILLKMTIFLALSEIEKKDVLEELDVN